MFKVYLPSQNLGCLGISFWWDYAYLDVYPLGKAFGVFARIGFRRYWWTLASFKSGRVRRDWF